MKPEALPIVGGTKGHYSLARVTKHWYVACTSRELGKKPLARTIFNLPLVLFRAEGGRPAALLNRCAHRNVPLSLGKVEGERLVCGYHGWEYDGCGVCQKVPALAGVHTKKARRVPRYPALERQGYVWVYPEEDSSPAVQPYVFDHLEDKRYDTVRYQIDLEASLFATLENILDVPHTAFLHKGLFRGVRKNEVTALVRKGSDRVEAEFVGEPRPEGLIGWLLSPKGGVVEHFDRFILPSIAQVEYRLGDKNHIFVSSVLTPISDFVTRMFAVISFRTVVPGILLKAFVTPIGKSIVQQDKVVLAQQTESVKRFGGEQFASTDVDLLGGHILRLLRQAERQEVSSADPIEQRIQFLA